MVVQVITLQHHLVKVTMVAAVPESLVLLEAEEVAPEQWVVTVLLVLVAPEVQE
jgi:hypothetical protein